MPVQLRLSLVQAAAWLVAAAVVAAGAGCSETAVKPQGLKRPASPNNKPGQLIAQDLKSRQRPTERHGERAAEDQRKEVTAPAA